MSAEYFRNLPTTERLWHVASNPNAASFAYDRLQVCRAAAQTQMRRLWEAAAASKPTRPEPRPTDPPAEILTYFTEAKARMAPLLYEVHFYFVAWANCGNMLRVLTGLPEFLEAKKIYDSYRRHFEHYTAARNSFEHYHDRLPGNSEERKVREVIQGAGASPSRIYFGVEGGHYKHSAMTWDITPASLELLNKAIDETLSVLHQHVDRLFAQRFPSA